MEHFGTDKNLDLWVKIPNSKYGAHYFNLVEKNEEIFQADFKHSLAKCLAIGNLFRVKNLMNRQI